MAIKRRLGTAVAWAVGPYRLDLGENGPWKKIGTGRWIRQRSWAELGAFGVGGVERVVWQREGLDNGRPNRQTEPYHVTLKTT
jgi:hypothetical protein